MFSASWKPERQYDDSAKKMKDLWPGGNINLCVSFYLHLSKYIDSDHLCYIYLASFTSPARSIPL